MKGRLQKGLLAAGAVLVAAAAAAAGVSVARTGGARGYPVSQLHQGVNPAMLTLWSLPLVTMVIGEPLRSPVMSASALGLPPAQSVYCVISRAVSDAGAVAAIALAARASAAASDAASARGFMIAVSF